MRANVAAALAASMAALAPRAAAQGCATVDIVQDCVALLVSGDYTCEDLACYAPTVPTSGVCGLGANAAAFAEGYTGQCSLTCGQNTDDGVLGEGACHALIAGGIVTCEQDFGAGQQYEGRCDFACGFCSFDPAPPPLPPPTPPSPRGNAGSSLWQCSTNDVLDLTSAPGACSAHIGAGELNCDEHFDGDGQHAGQCAKACQLNILEHPLAFMPEANLEAFAAIGSLQTYYWGYVGATTAQEFVAQMQPGLCQTLIEADLAAGYGDACSGVLNWVLPPSFGGQGACDFACNRCTAFGDDVWSAAEYGHCGSPITANAGDIAQNDPMFCERALSTGGMLCYGDFAPGNQYQGYCDNTCFGAALTTIDGFQAASFIDLTSDADCTAGGGTWVAHTPANTVCKTPAGEPTGDCCTDPTSEDAPQCAAWITAFGGPDLACPNVFAPDRMRAGQCDIACGYCAGALPPPPPPAAVSISSLDSFGLMSNRYLVLC